MKKLTYLLFLAIGVTACSVESLDSTENLLTADAKVKLASTTSIEFDETVCVGDLANFTFNFPQAYNSNEKEQKTLVILDLWVDGEEGEEGEWVNLLNENYEGAGPKYFSYDFGGEDTYLLQYRIGNGSENKFAQISVEVEDCSTCENLLVADLVCGDVNTLTLTFTAVEAGPIVIQGGLNAKAEIQGNSVGVGVEETTKPGAPGNASVTTWEGNLEACQEVSITINFIGGNSIGDWSATRGEATLGSTYAKSCN